MTMPLDRAVEIFAVVQLLIIGISHMVQPRAWAEFFIALRERGDAGVFVVAFLSLWFGAVIVAFHNVWSGLPAVLTVLGWAQLTKAAIYFTVPAVGMRRLQAISIERAWVFAAAGPVLLGLGGLIAFHLWQTR
jgi:hypothetical protein